MNLKEFLEKERQDNLKKQIQIKQKKDILKKKTDGFREIFVKKILNKSWVKLNELSTKIPVFNVEEFDRKIKKIPFLVSYNIKINIYQEERHYLLEIYGEPKKDYKTISIDFRSLSNQKSIGLDFFSIEEIENLNYDTFITKSLQKLKEF